MAKVDTSKLVPVKVALDIAKIIRREAAKIAKQKKAALQSSRVSPNVYNANHIGITTPTVTQGQITVGLTLSEVGASFEYGSDPHSIPAKNSPWLIFKGTKDYDGQLIHIKQVNHPGFAPRPFIEPAKKATVKERHDLLEREVGKNIRTVTDTILRGMIIK